MATISEQARCHVLGQTMDVNCFKWISTLCIAEQKRMFFLATLWIAFYSLSDCCRDDTSIGPQGRGGEGRGEGFRV